MATVIKLVHGSIIPLTRRVSLHQHSNAGIEPRWLHGADEETGSPTVFGRCIYTHRYSNEMCLPNKIDLMAEDDLKAMNHQAKVLGFDPKKFRNWVLTYDDGE